MSFVDERLAIEARLETFLPQADPNIDRAYGTNATFTPTPGKSWVWLTLLAGPGNQVELGNSNPLLRYQGIIQVTISTAEELGENPALQIANQVAAIYTRARFAAGLSGLIRCRIASAPKRLGVKDGWNRMVQDIPYLRDVTGLTADLGTGAAFPDKPKWYRIQPDGIASTFNLPFAPSSPQNVLAFLNAGPQTSFTISGAQITFPFVPAADDVIVVFM